jgi:processive 1,2-diacylglycerol beta-glucosyltransferase
MPRVLICYLVGRSGHHAAALAVQRALQAAHPGVDTRCVDLVEYCHPHWERVIRRTYLTTIRRTPELWDALYDSIWVDRLTRRVRQLVQRGTGKALLRLMSEFRPDAVVCTQAHPCAVMASYAAAHEPRLPLWGVVTDFVPHRFWVVDAAPVRYVVPTEAAADRLMWLGVDRGRIHVFGIPVTVRAGEATAAAHDGHRVLVMGGSRGIGVRFRTLRHLDRSRADFTIDVICAMNARLRRRLVARRQQFRHPLRVRGYVQDAALLMRKASLLITKPGGLTCAEAMATGVPMILVRPLPGQERKNTEVMLRHGAALHLSRERDVPVVVGTVLKNPALLDMMRHRASELGKPDAARRVAQAVLESIGRKAPA